MDITKYIQNSTMLFSKQNYSNFKRASVITIATILTIALISNSLVSSDVFADKKSPRDVCKINQFACSCDSLTIEGNAKCCTYGTDGRMYCDVCEIDLKTGDYINCHPEDTIKFPSQSNLPDNVTVGGVFERDQQHNFGQAANLNTTNGVGTFSNNDDNN